VAVVYPILLPDRLDVIVRLPGATDPLHHSQPLDTSSLKRTIAELQRQLRKPPDLSARTDSTSLLLPHAKQLHQWLLAPLEPSLQARGITLLVFVPDSALRNLPMAVLHDGKRFLGDRYAIAVAPGMVLTPSIRKPGSKPRVLGAGVSKSSQVSSLPEGSNFFPALPAVEQELTALRRRTGATLLLNERFTSPALQLALQSGDYSVVHLATHGQFSSNPSSTFLITGIGELIRVKQLADFLQPSQRRTGNSLDLLILSACESASNDDNANLGLAAVAARSGASSTIASLWSVNDEATALLMDSFYQHWLRDRSDGRPISKAKALSLAQSDVRNATKTSHPYYWAAFTLLGDWR
jgi:CHAT domain-containing protein